MAEELELLHTYLEGVRLWSGAAASSLFVPGRSHGAGGDLLVHEGEGEPLPELANAPEARRRLGNRTWPAEAGEAELLGLPVVVSQVPEGLLLPLRAGAHSMRLRRIGRGRKVPARRPEDHDRTQEPPFAWLGLRFATGEVWRDRLATLAPTREAPGGRTASSLATWWLTVGGDLARHATDVTAILRDPTTGLPERVRFQAILDQAVEEARSLVRPLSLMLVNPDDFEAVNQLHGREEGDRVIAEISRRLQDALRRTDPLARYGGVIFAVILADTSAETAEAVARKVRHALSDETYGDPGLQLDFSFGIATLERFGTAAADTAELLRRANHALGAAKSEGSGQIAVWRPETADLQATSLDRLSGIFTGRVSKDYRNMALLWSAIDAMAQNREFGPLAREVVGRLFDSFKADRAALFVHQEGSLDLVAGLTRRTSRAGAEAPLETVEISAAERQVVLRAIEQRSSQSHRWKSDGLPHSLFAPPLVAGDRTLGCLFVAGAEGPMSLEASDTALVEALASHVAMALDRARLEERDRRFQEEERQRLQSELNLLRRAVRQAKLIYRSPQMETLLERARRAATTDATVLVTGESGTGKELLARTIHEVSDRRKEPFVVVDCGAVAASLIESELFGHERGAYTGAQEKRSGHFAQASGGTVLLDEIGELPLEVQAKLLRFVQERQFTPVGGTRPVRVDVRIVAATNRNLLGEVEAGRFREDLYHRLHVVHLRIPALRERPDDVLLLARHFFETFVVQYQRPLRRIAPAAELALASYDWPGNVRELQNRLRQAVILAGGDELGVEDLGLPAAPGAESSGAAGDLAQTPAAHRAAAAGAGLPAPDGERAWLDLRIALRDRIARALAHGGSLPPLGQWLGDQLVLASFEAADGVAREAADTAGLPESTFRRRLRKAQERAQGEPPPGWETVSHLLPGLATLADSRGELLQRAETTLLQEILERLPEATAKGADLLGVTPPTFRRRRDELRSAPVRTRPSS